MHQKLIIQIPCFNEEETLPVTLAALPRSIPGVEKVEWLIIDDGSTDRTAEIAEEHGVDHIIKLPHNHGLAKAFVVGLDACLRNGANIIVNTDADNQYNADDIPKLVEPVQEGVADIVIGARPISDIKHFSPAKKFLQKMGSWIVRVASNTNVPDAPSGFRAFSRDAAMQLSIFSAYTYTLESIIQAGHKNMAIKSVNIRTNESLRPSRLMTSMSRYIRNSVLIILRIFMTYQPARFFGIPGAIAFSAGIIMGLQVLKYHFEKEGGDHIQLQVLMTLCLTGGFSLMIVGLVTDLIAVNRKLLEEVRTRMMRIEYRVNSIRENNGQHKAIVAQAKSEIDAISSGIDAPKLLIKPVSPPSEEKKSDLTHQL